LGINRIQAVGKSHPFYRNLAVDHPKAGAPLFFDGRIVHRLADTSQIISASACNALASSRPSSLKTKPPPEGPSIASSENKNWSEEDLSFGEASGISP
jgi:hypothetical protein